MAGGAIYILDKVGADIAKTTGEIELMKKALATANANGDALGTAELTAGIERASDALKKMQQQAGDGLLGRDIVARTKEQITLLDDTFKGSTVSRLQSERALLAGLLDGDKLTAAQRNQVEIDLAAKDKEIRDASYKAYEAGEERQATAAALSKAKVIAIREGELKQAVAIYGQGSDQAIAAEQKIAQAKEAAARQGAAVDPEAVRQAYASEVEAAREAASQTETILNGQLAAHKLGAQQWLSASLASLDKEQDAIQDAADKAIASAKLTSNQKIAIANDEQRALAQIAQKEAQDQIKAAEDAAKEWKSYGDTVAGVMNSQVNGLLKGTVTFGQAVKNMTASAVEDVIKYCVKWAAEHAATIAMNIAGLGVQTGATVAATAAQTGAIATGAAAQHAINATTVAGDAERAAAGAYAALAGVPIIGPIIAPAAAAVAFAGVEAFGSFDSGAWSLPQDMLIGAHQGEMIIPQRGGLADEFRGLASNMRSGAGGGASISANVAPQFHFHSMDSSTIANTLRANGGTIAKAVNQAVRDGAHHGLRRLTGV